jgi:hypothetical protein
MSRVEFFLGLRRAFTKQKFDANVYLKKGVPNFLCTRIPPILKPRTFLSFFNSTTVGVQAYDGTTKIWTIYNFSTNDKTAGQSNVMSLVKRSVDGRSRYRRTGVSSYVGAAEGT